MGTNLKELHRDEELTRTLEIYEPQISYLFNIAWRGLTKREILERIGVDH